LREFDQQVHDCGRQLDALRKQMSAEGVQTVTSNIVESDVSGLSSPFGPVPTHTFALDQAGASEIDATGRFDQAAEIADAVISLMRIYGNLKARVANTADPEIAALFLLVRLVKDGPKRAKELADLTSADPSTVSRQVATLVKTGLIERKADPEDGRASILVPTELGVTRVQEHFVNRGQMIQPMIADWPETDRSDFLRLLRCYADRLESRREEVVQTMSKSHHLQSAHHLPLPQHVPTPPPPHASTERSN
jgi:DNA-binding MarR family transcriptional regulator